MDGTDGCNIENVVRDPIKARIIVKGGDAISNILNLTNYLAMTADGQHSRKYAEYAADAIREFEKSIEHLL